MEDCPIGILIDLSEPTENQSQLISIPSQEEDKENVHPLTDSIEIERSADTERRLSLTLKSSDDIQNRILRDVTEQSLPNSAKKCQSPALRLIDDETFDFDLAVSPAVEAEVVTNEEEDEIFFGPVCFTERLKEAIVKQEEAPPLSPLNAKQFALMVKEANYVAYRIRNSKTSSSSESSPGESKTSCPSADEEISPSIRKHTRSGTFTKCQSPLELLPEEIRKVLPVIGDSKKTAPNVNDCQKTLFTSTEEHHASEIVGTNKVDEKSNMNTVKSNVKRPSIGRLQQPSKFQGSKLSKPASIKYASSCESLDSITSGHESDSNCSVASDSNDIVRSKNNLPKSQMPGKNTVTKISRLQVPVNKKTRSFNSSMNCSLNVSTNESSSKVNPNTSRLAIPKSGSHANSKGVTPKYGIQPKFLNNSANLNKNNLTKSEDKKQQKSVEVPRRNFPRLKAKEAATVNDGATKKGISGLRGPITKLSLMKPAEMQKRNKKTIIINGPMKAVQPIDAINSTVLIKKDKTSTKLTTCVSTPVKQDKCVKPKLLANNFTTPCRSSSVSSTSTPVSSRRRSFLPTPKKSIKSVGCIPDSPLLRRTGSSTSSRQSLSSCSSVSESSVFNSSMTRPRIGSTQKSTRLYSTDVNEKSPSTMKMSKPKVVHTPQLPQKVQSKWSPIRRTRPMSRDEEIIQCTKRKLKDQ